MYIGRFDVCYPEFICNNCHSVNKPCVEQNNLWPGDANHSSYVFHEDLFLFYDLLRKNVPGMSELGFIRILEEFSGAKGRVSR